MATVATHAEQHAAMAAQIDSLNGWKTWAIRAIGGALIAGAIALLFVVR